MFLYVNFISGLITKEFLELLNNKLVSSVTFFFLDFFKENRVTDFFKFCTQTGSVRNGWKLPVAKWTHLLLGYNLVGQRPKRRMLWSQLDALHDFQNLQSFFGKCDILENRENSVSSKISSFLVFFTLVHQAVHTHAHTERVEMFVKENCVQKQKRFYVVCPKN